MRVVGVTLFFGLFLILEGVLQSRGWTGQWKLGLWFAIAVGFWAFRARVPAQRAMALLVPLLDMPLVFLIQLSSYPTTPNPGAVAGYSLGLFVLLVALAALSQNRAQIVFTGVVGAVLEAVLQWQADISPGAIVSTFVLMGVTAAICAYTSGSLSRLLGQVVGNVFAKRKAEAELERRSEELGQLELVAGILQLREGIKSALRPQLTGAGLAHAADEAAMVLLGREPWVQVSLPQGLVLEAGVRPQTPQELSRQPAPGIKAIVAFPAPWDSRTTQVLEAVVDELAAAALEVTLEAQRQVENAWRELSRFVDTAAHELNSPVGAMLSDLRFVKAELKTDDPAMRDAVLGAEQCGERVADFLLQLRSLVKSGAPVARLQVAALLNAFDAHRGGSTPNPQGAEALVVLGHGDVVLEGLAELGKRIGPGPATAGFSGRGLTITLAFDARPEVPPPLSAMGVTFSRRPAVER